MYYRVKIDEHCGNGWNEWAETRAAYYMDFDNVVKFLQKYVKIINNWNTHYNFIMKDNGYEVHIADLSKSTIQFEDSDIIAYKNTYTNISYEKIIHILKDLNALDTIPYYFHDGGSGKEDKGYYHLKEEKK